MVPRWSIASLIVSSCVLCTLFPVPRSSRGQGIMTVPPRPSREEGIIANSRSVLTEAVSSSDKGVPRAMLHRAEAVVIVPRLLKIGVIAGVRHGEGVLLVKDNQGVWQLPQFVTLTGGSVGWQAGIVSSDLVLVFTNRRRVEQLLSNGRFTIGVDAAAAAGPVGRTVSAATDGKLSAEIYSYARSRGLFAGVSVDGAVIQIDHVANPRFYPAGNIPASAWQLTTYVAQLAGGKAGVPATTPLPAGTIPAPVSGVPVVPTPAAPPVGTRVDAPQHQVARLQPRLERILDPAWRRYLALPRLGPQADSGGLLEAYKQLLAKYDRVASDAKYGALTRRTEFQQMHAALRAYVAVLQTQTAPTVDLPPPPGTQP